MVLATVLHGQAVPGPTVPCRNLSCTVVVDWGVGKTLNDMPPDRKYGAPADFEKMLAETVQSHGMLALAPSGAVSIRVQATYKTRVLCEDMAGTTPDRTCATIGEAIVNFATAEPGVKLPTSVRLTNRCGASGAMMSMKQFGKFVGDMIWWSIEGDRLGENKPMGKC